MPRAACDVTVVIDELNKVQCRQDAMLFGATQGCHEAFRLGAGAGEAKWSHRGAGGLLIETGTGLNDPYKYVHRGFQLGSVDPDTHLGVQTSSHEPFVSTECLLKMKLNMVWATAAVDSSVYAEGGIVFKGAKFMRLGDYVAVSVPHDQQYSCFFVAKSTGSTKATVCEIYRTALMANVSDGATCDFFLDKPSYHYDSGKVDCVAEGLVNSSVGAAGVVKCWTKCEVAINKEGAEVKAEAYCGVLYRSLSAPPPPPKVHFVGGAGYFVVVHENAIVTATLM
jgi:hypothetical protein